MRRLPDDGDDATTRARAPGARPTRALASWVRERASSVRERVRDAREGRRRARIEEESRAHAARLARAIARDDGGAPSAAVSRATRREALREALMGGDEVDARRLRLLASDGGVPDDDGGEARALVWKLCLGYLPKERAMWASVERERREAYGRFVEEFCRRPSENARGGEWIDGRQGDEIAEQIDRDVMRVHPDMHFFNDESEDGEARRRKDEMRDALYVFAKLNPGVGYVQGMHEMYGCIYYVFETAMKDKSEPLASAADAFYCFSEIFGEFRDVFVMELDATDQGVRAHLDTLSDMLAVYGPEVHSHLHSMNLTTSMYAFRWITLLFTQDFEFADVLRLWDVMLASPRSRMECLLRLCVACVLNIGSELIDGDFATCMKMLQNYPPVDIRRITRLAAALPYGIG